jgi:hypothetical protein
MTTKEKIEVAIILILLVLGCSILSWAILYVPYK